MTTTRYYLGDSEVKAKETARQKNTSMTIVNLESLNQEAFEVIKPRTDPPLLKGPYTLRQGMWAWKYAPANVADAAGVAAAPMQPVQGNAGAFAAAGQVVLQMGGKAVQIGAGMVAAVAGAGAGAGAGADDKGKGAPDAKDAGEVEAERLLKGMRSLEARTLELEGARQAALKNKDKGAAQRIAAEMDAATAQREKIVERLEKLGFAT
jgi:hypothetical protein